MRGLSGSSHTSHERASDVCRNDPWTVIPPCHCRDQCRGRERTAIGRWSCEVNAESARRKARPLARSTAPRGGADRVGPAEDQQGGCRARAKGSSTRHVEDRMLRVPQDRALCEGLLVKDQGRKQTFLEVARSARTTTVDTEDPMRGTRYIHQR